MSQLTLDQASAVLDGVRQYGRRTGLQPLSIAIVDAGGHLLAFNREDGPGAALRPAIAIGKAFGAVGLGRSSRAIGEMAVERPHFVNGLVGASGGRMVPVPGGVLIKDAVGTIVGAVGVTGDTSDNDEAAAVAGIEAAGLTPEA
jgi:uncharacterized protein GlcG (DUF336 family)